MGRFCSGLFVACLVTSVGLSAQGQTGSKTAGQAGAEKAITVSGCIQSAPAASATSSGGGAAASASASASSSRFVLAVKPEKASAGGAVGTSGTTGTRYALQGDDKAISPHLNHQVEITGTVEPMPAGASASSSTGSTAKAASSPTLRVQSVKMVAAVCS